MLTTTPFRSRLTTLTLALLLLAGCSSVNQEQWPQQLPPRSHYLDAYANDHTNQQYQSRQDYLKWVVNFYQGTVLYRRGWNQMIDEVKQTLTDQEQQNLAERRLREIGKQISTEWAKNRKARKINSRHVYVWGNSLLTAVANGTLFPYMEQVAIDVNAILNDQLEGDAVVESRYFAEDPNDAFN